MGFKSVESGKFWVSKRFREKHQADYAKFGYDLSKPFQSEQHFKQATIRVSIKLHMTEEQCEIAARWLGLIE